MLGIDDAPFDKFKDKKCLVVGAFFRGSKQLEGVLTTEISVDGDDSTEALAEMGE